MVGTPQGSPPQTPPRLDPFALPSDTTSRFILLIVAVLTASLFAYNLLSSALPSTQARLVRGQQCVEAAQADAVPDGAAPIDEERIGGEVLYDCLRPYRRWVAAVILLGVVCVLLVALALYVLTPTWKIRRRRLVALEEDDAPELVASFQDLCRQAGLPRSPVLVWNPVAPRGGALAFGRSGRSYVAVGAGLVVQYYTDPEATMAVLRHELAHVVNRDVDTTYAAQSLWYSVLLVGLLPLLVVELALVGVVLERLWRLAALIVLIYAARNAVLRAREYYADASAGISEHQRATLSRVLDRISSGDSKPLTRAWRVHPDRDSRVRTLWDTAELFRPRLWDALAAGVVAGLAYPTLRHHLFLVVPLDYTLYIGAGAALLSASLMGAVLGVGIMRASLAARARDTPLPRVARVALAAGLGFAIGSRLSLVAEGMTIASSVVLIFFMLISVHWLAATADAWFDVAPATRSGRVFSWAGIVAAALVMWGAGWVSLFGVAASSEHLSAPEFAGRFVAEHALTPVVMGVLVIFPFTASVLRRRLREDSAPSWLMVAAPQQEPPPWPQRPPLAVASSLRWGALGAAAFCVLIVTLRALDLSPQVLIGPLDEAAFEYAAGLHYGAIGLAVLLQSGLGALVALRARRLPVLHALFALPTSVPLMALGVILSSAMDAGGLPVDLWRTAKLILAGGAIAALVVGGATEALRQSPWRGRALVAGLGDCRASLRRPVGR